MKAVGDLWLREPPPRAISIGSRAIARDDLTPDAPVTWAKLGCAIREERDRGAAQINQHGAIPLASRWLVIHTEYPGRGERRAGCR